MAIFDDLTWELPHKENLPWLIQTTCNNKPQNISASCNNFFKACFPLCTVENSNFRNFCWMIRTQPISLFLNYFYFTYSNSNFLWFESQKCLIILGQYSKITAIVSIARTLGKSYFELIKWGQRVGFFSKSLFPLLLQNPWNKYFLWNRRLNFCHSSRIHWLIVIKILRVNQEKQG